jgi:hypothetical protein
MNYSQPPTPFMRASKQLIQSVFFFLAFLFGVFLDQSSQTGWLVQRWISTFKLYVTHMNLNEIYQHSASQGCEKLYILITVRHTNVVRAGSLRFGCNGTTLPVYRKSWLEEVEINSTFFTKKYLVR